MDSVDKSVVVVLAVVEIVREIGGVNPDIGRLLNGNAVSVVSQDLGDLHVSDNDVRLP